MEILYSFLYLFIISVAVYVFGRILPYGWIKENSFPLKSFAFEKEGKIYEKLKIKKWKNKLPDASKIINRFIKKVPKKSIDNKSLEKVPVLIKESCKAEITHFAVSVLGFYCCKISKKFGWIISVLFSFANLPFIIIQRYNRPRLLKAIS